MYKFSVKICLILACLLGYLAPGFAAIKCWKNDKGVRECSYTVPKKYSGYEIQILNDRGQVTQTIPAERTAAQKKQDAALAKIAAEDKRIKDEQRRRDLILVRTFVSVEDIILNRESKLNAIDSIIKISKSNRKKHQKILDEYTKQAGNFERKNQKVPETILKNIEKSKGQLKEFDDFIETRNQEKLTIHQKYDADIERFKELKSIKPK